VVTPFYNTERYLAECIESVIAQSYQNWEYILVNNCSTDNSLEIVEAYARRDDRIRIVNNNSFLTQVQNYNHALRQISTESKYCKIVQADDWIFPTCLMEMVEVGEANPTVGIISSYRIDDRKVTNDGLPYPSRVSSGKKICCLSLLGNFFVFGSPTSIMIRSDIIRNREPFYSESSYHEDTEACYEILQDCDFGFVHQVLTFTRRENESIFSSMSRFDPYCRLEKLSDINKYGSIYLNKEEYESLLKEMKCRYLQFLARSIFEGKGKEFWQYHKIGQERIGYQFDWKKLLKYIFLEFFRRYLDSKFSIGGFIRRLFSSK
jgi:glycosyltransferase involved in cell wall biosynthesis